MRLYTILKLIGQAIKNMLSDISSLKTSKQNKTWAKIGETTGTLTYTATKYNELLLIVNFGGVNTTNLIPVTTLNASSAKTFCVGYYGNVIYVKVSRTQAVMSKQPSGYTATIYLYGR